MKALSDTGRCPGWQHRLKQRSASKPKDSAPLKLLRLEPVASLARADDAIELQCGRHCVLVRRGFDDALLRRVLEDER